MARGVNKAILMGNLGKDPEIRYTQSGSAVANFSLATTERRKQGDQWVDHTEWHNIVVFGKTAENCGQYLQKGSQIYLEGRIQTRKWEDRDGNTKYMTEIVAFDVHFLGRTKGQSGGYEGPQAGGGRGAPRAGAAAGGTAPVAPPAGAPEDFPGPEDAPFDPNDDVPF